jgi:hypothetical protein
LTIRQAAADERSWQKSMKANCLGAFLALNAIAVLALTLRAKEEPRSDELGKQAVNLGEIQVVK